VIELQADRLSKAIAKANKVRNHVRMLAWRKYEVRTPEQHTYTITFDVQEGKKLAHCTCAAGAKNLPCYHIAGAVALHCYIAKAKAQAEPICEPAPLRPAHLHIAINNPGVLVKPQPPSLGRVNGLEL
jgi:hypothetical protein